MKQIFRKSSEVLSFPWQWKGTHQETTDQIFRASKLEDRIYQELRAEDEEMDHLEQEAQVKLRSFPALPRDVFQSLYSLCPRRNEEESLSVPARKFHSGIISHVTEQSEYPTLKNICEGRELPAYEATAQFTEKISEELDALLQDLGGEKGSLATLRKLMDDREKAEEKLSSLMEHFKRAQGSNETLEKELVKVANQLHSKNRQVDAVAQNIDHTLLQQRQPIQNAVAAAMTAAREKAEETSDIIASWSDEPGNVSCTPRNKALLNRVRESDTLRLVSKYLGRYRELFAKGRRNGFAYGRGETYSLELGNQIARALTSELTLMAAPETLPLFLRKLQTRNIKQYLRREPIRKGMGDIICCLDESGSTRGEIAAWGKAVALTLLEIAEESGRQFALIHFSDSSSIRTDLFLKGQYTMEDKLAAAEIFLDGGTSFERPISEAIRLMEEEGFEKADIVFLTDGECGVSESFLHGLREKQQQHPFQITGILLDSVGQKLSFSLESFCHKIYRTSQLMQDEIVQSIMYDYIGG